MKKEKKKMKNEIKSNVKKERNNKEKDTRK